MSEHRISKLIIKWYNESKRELPWRNISDPYRIWISEIILQQTRVEQGLDYYLRFIERFPNVQSLAEAEEDEVLKYWQGLGYYSRVRNLHAAARSIEVDFKGVFPKEYHEVRRLKGVGDYTAAAICSFAYNMPYSAVDGNVYRVLSRLFNVDLPIDGGKGKRLFADLAQQLLSKTNPATHNQAMMEFGARQCVPKNPNCEKCPLQEICMAYSDGTIAKLPVKLQKTTVKNRYFNYFRIHLKDKIYLKKRTENDIWRNLYEFPLIETAESLNFEQLSQTTEFKNLFHEIDQVEIRLIAADVIHILSHRRISASFYEVYISNPNKTLNDYLEIIESDFDRYAVSRLIQLLVTH
ncbi:MAG: A/G-specific adenine glycosylase [Bacteroidales bacterium]